MGVGAVIFDFNGVLVDDEAVHFTLFREILAQAGVSISESDYHERYLGFDDWKCFEAALLNAGHTLDHERIDRLVAQKARRYFEAAEQGLRFFPAAAETLQAVAAHWPVAICSGALRSEIEYALRRMGRLDQVAVIVSAENTLRCKPDPEGYQLALAGLRACAHNGCGHGAVGPSARDAQRHLAASGCLVVEDSLAGMVAAKSAGMRAVGITNTYSTDQLYQAGADAVVDGLETLTPEWIKQRFPQ